MATTGFLLCLVSLCLYLAAAADLTFDYHNNELTETDQGNGFEVVKAFEDDASFPEYICSRHGVIKLTFSNTRRMAEMKLFYDPNELFIGKYNFDLSDSPYSLGEGKLAEESKRNETDTADVTTVSRDLVIAGRDSKGIIYKRANFMKGNLTINVSNHFFQITNGDVGDPGTSIVRHRSGQMFALNGIDANRDLYLGINRVADQDTKRAGFGLCRQTLSAAETDWALGLSVMLRLHGMQLTCNLRRPFLRKALKKIIGLE